MVPLAEVSWSAAAAPAPPGPANTSALISVLSFSRSQCAPMSLFRRSLYSYDRGAGWCTIDVGVEAGRLCWGQSSSHTHAHAPAPLPLGQPASCPGLWVPRPSPAHPRLCLMEAEGEKGQGCRRAGRGDREMLALARATGSRLSLLVFLTYLLTVCQSSLDRKEQRSRAVSSCVSDSGKPVCG